MKVLAGISFSLLCFFYIPDSAGVAKLRLKASYYLKPPATYICVCLLLLNSGFPGREMRVLLERCAATALSSKLVAAHKDFFSKMVVDAVMLLDDLLPLSMIGMKKVKGGALQDSRLIAGVAFKKTFSYAGFEMQRKKYKNPKIALLNVELELKAEKENAEVRLDNVQVND